MIKDNPYINILRNINDNSFNDLGSRLEITHHKTKRKHRKTKLSSKTYINKNMDTRENKR